MHLSTIVTCAFDMHRFNKKQLTYTYILILTYLLFQSFVFRRIIGGVNWASLYVTLHVSASPLGVRSCRIYKDKGKGSPYSIAERI